MTLNEPCGSRLLDLLGDDSVLVLPGWGFPRIHNLFLTPVDILPERCYVHLECLLEKSASASNCSKERWTC